MKAKEFLHSELPGVQLTGDVCTGHRDWGTSDLLLSVIGRD